MIWLERALYALEWLSAILLMALALVSVGGFIAAFASTAHEGFLSTDNVLRLLDELLVLFILIELIKMAFAYMHGANVIPVAMEAVLIALARKAVAVDFSDDHALKKSASLAILMLAVGATWFLVSRSEHAGSKHEHPAPPT